MARNLEDRTNTLPVDATNPHSGIRDESAPGANDGTPVNAAVNFDPLVFFQKLMSEAGIDPNELPDNSVNGFQLFEALITIVRRSSGGSGAIPFQSYSLPGEGVDSIGAVAGAYGNGVYVVVGTANSDFVSYTSPDGFVWTKNVISTIGTGFNFQDLQFSNGLFVAVSGGTTQGTSQVATSTDGVNWSLEQSSASLQWRGVTFGNGVWVAVARSGTNRVMSSPDAVNWTTRNTGFTKDWIDVAYGNGLFVAVSINNDGDDIMTSPDGINWTLRTNPSPSSLVTVHYGNGLFVAAGQGGVVLTSPDGINWTQRTTDEAGRSFQGSVFGAGIHTLIARTGTNRVTSSSNGINWNGQEAPIAGDFTDIFYGDGKFVGIVGGAGTPPLIITG